MHARRKASSDSRRYPTKIPKHNQSHWEAVGHIMTLQKRQARTLERQRMLGGAGCSQTGDRQAGGKQAAEKVRRKVR